MESLKYLIVGLIILLFGISCQAAPPDNSTGPQVGQEDLADQPDPAEALNPLPIPAGDLIQPGDLVYRGFFRLPEGSGKSNWEYSGHGLTFYPDGDRRVRFHKTLPELVINVTPAPQVPATSFFGLGILVLILSGFIYIGTIRRR